MNPKTLDFSDFPNNHQIPPVKNYFCFMVEFMATYFPLFVCRFCKALYNFCLCIYVCMMGRRSIYLKKKM